MTPFLESFAPEFSDLLQLLVEAQFVRRIATNAADESFEFRITWKGLQFIEMYKIHQEATDPDDVLESFLRLMSFY